MTIMTINEYQEKVYQEILNELRDNNIVRIYGPSGVGKTTLINRFNQEKLSFFSTEKTYVFEGIAGEKEKCAFFAGFFCKMNTASRKNKDNTYILGN